MNPFADEMQMTFDSISDSHSHKGAHGHNMNTAMYHEQHSD